MLRSLFKIGLLVVAGLVCYNYFFGDAKEKEQSRRIFKGVGSVFGEVRDLVRVERKKFDGGKYDSALDKMQGVLDRLKDHSKTGDGGNIASEVASLESKKRDLEAQLDRIKQLPDEVAPAPATDLKAKGKNPTMAKPAPTTSSKLEQAAQLAKQMEDLNAQLQGVVNRVASPEDQQPY